MRARVGAGGSSLRRARASEVHPEAHRHLTVAVSTVRVFGHVVVGHGRDVASGLAVSFIGDPRYLFEIDRALRAGEPAMAAVPLWSVYAMGEAAYRLN